MTGINAHQGSVPSPTGMIFDVDGVLVASPHERAWRDSLTQLMTEEWRHLTPSSSYHPEKFTTHVYQQYVAGKPRASGARAVLDHFNIPDAGVRAEEYARTKQALLERLIANGEFEGFADALRLVAALHRRGIPMAAASSSKNANTMMAQIDLANADGAPHGAEPIHLLQVFAANVCGRDVEHGKPSPDLFLLAAEELGVPPVRCVVVEDATSGIEAAKAGGMRAIGVARLDDADMLQKAGADIVVTNLDAIAVDRLAEGRLEH
ncbi:MAG: HAD-IA family hydrolase [Rhodospirillales bacterium]|nr:HAD-IA family hydrolase [Rhodospirillales bacterium]